MITSSPENWSIRLEYSSSINYMLKCNKSLTNKYAVNRSYTTATDEARDKHLQRTGPVKLQEKEWTRL